MQQGQRSGRLLRSAPCAHWRRNRAHASMQASLRSANAVRTLQDRFRPEALSSACPKRRQPPDEPADWHIGHPRPAAMPSQATSPHTSSSKPPWRPPTRTPNSDVMQTDTGKASRVISEGRHKASGAVSVAWLADVGPRDENQDRAVAHIGSDGSWMVAVADGMDSPASSESAGKRERVLRPLCPARRCGSERHPPIAGWCCHN